MTMLGVAPPWIATLSINLRCATTVLPGAIGPPNSPPLRTLTKEPINPPRQHTASAEIPIASDAPPRPTSRGFLPWRFADAGPGVRRATIMGPPSANLHTSSHSITAHDANEPSLNDQGPPMQRATINHLSSETALPNRSRIAECCRKSQNIVALAGFASGRAPAVRESAAFIFCLPIPPVCLLVFLLVSAAIGDENYFKFN